MSQDNTRGRARRRRRPLRPPPGTSPGALLVDSHGPAPTIHVLAYSPDQLEERDIEDPREVSSFLERFPVTWVNVDGLDHAGTMHALADVFGLHRLALEDVVNTGQRAKVEEFEDHLFIVARMVTLGEHLETEQISLFLGKRFVLTFQEHPGDCFEGVRERIRKKTGRIRNAGPDYLAYALLDAVIDHYFPVLERCGENLEELEDEVISRPDNETIAGIHAIKRELLTIRRAVWPKREAVNSLLRDSMPLITDETRVYLRDCYDHVIQIIDLLENYREIASGLMDVYLSSVSNRMNEVMKVLTIFAVIFIPLTFIAGIYGMNFDPQASPYNMPELHWFFGYPFVLAIMLLAALGMLVYFRRKGWLGSSPRRSAGARKGTAKGDRH